MRHNRTLRTIALAATALLVATACGGDDDTDAEGGLEGQTLVVWDIYVRGAENEVAEQLVAEFESEHGVTVERSTKTLDDLKTTLGLAFTQEDGPDVASVNQGLSDMGALVEAGLLLDLSDFAAERGWFDEFSASVLNRNMFQPDGTGFGSGSLYGIAPQAEVVGWFYNKAKYTELGLAIPTTFEELEFQLGAIKEAGLTPITFGNLDAWPAIHTYGAVQHVDVGVDYLNDLIFNLGDASWATPENVAAAETVVKWADAGYFTDNFEGIGYDDSIALYAGGDAALMLTGSWVSGELDQDAFGFFLTPGRAAGEVVPQIGGQGVPLAIRADTAVADLAKEYVDFMVSERAAELWAENGFLPAAAPPAGTVPDGTLLADIVTGWTAVRDANALGHFLDWASPTMYDTITAQLQALFAGAVDAQGFIDSLQADYDAA